MVLLLEGGRELNGGGSLLFQRITKGGSYWSTVGDFPGGLIGGLWYFEANERTHIPTYVLPKWPIYAAMLVGMDGKQKRPTTIRVSSPYYIIKTPPIFCPLPISSLPLDPL